VSSAFDESAGAGPAGTGGAQSVRRAIAVLRAVACADNAVRLRDIVDETGLHTATTHRLLTVLSEEGLIEQDKATKEYRLGPQLFALTAADTRRQNFLGAARGTMQRIADETDDTVYFTMRVGDEALCLARIEGAYPIRTLTLDVGDRRPLGVGAGSLALLAFLDPKEIARTINLSAKEYPRFGVNSDDVRGFVREAQRLGYALNDSRILPGMAAIGLPVRSASGEIVGAISVAAIKSRMKTPRRDALVALLQREILELSPLAGVSAKRASGIGPRAHTHGSPGERTGFTELLEVWHRGNRALAQ